MKTSPGAMDSNLAFTLLFGFVRVRVTSALSPGSSVPVCAPVTVAATKDSAEPGTESTLLSWMNAAKAKPATPRMAPIVAMASHGHDFPVATHEGFSLSGTSRRLRLARAAWHFIRPVRMTFMSPRAPAGVTGTTDWSGVGSGGVVAVSATTVAAGPRRWTGQVPTCRSRRRPIRSPAGVKPGAAAATPIASPAPASSTAAITAMTAARRPLRRHRLLTTVLLARSWA